MTTTTVVAARVRNVEADALKQLADAIGTTRSNVIADAIRRALSETGPKPRDGLCNRMPQLDRGTAFSLTAGE